MEFHFLGLHETNRSSHVTSDMDSMHFFTLFYFMFCICVVFPVPVFVSCGLTVDSIFSKWIGSEMDSFVSHHIRRIVANVFVHSSLPLGYVLLRMYYDRELDVLDSIFWQFFFFGSLTLLFIAALQVYNWRINRWQKHPVVMKLRAFAAASSLGDIITEIDNDFRSPHKVILQCDAMIKVISTPNWLLKTSSYSVDVAHQSDVSLQVMAAVHHEIAAQNRGGVQYLTIRVTSARPNVAPFLIRIKSTSLKDLQDMIPRPIRILENIKIHTTLQDRFLDVFKEQVALNPTVDVDFQVEDACWGCSEKLPNVKLVKTCGDTEGANSCNSCFCRPMWCVDCMGIWFASRQDQDRPEQWMSAKCTCPLCRSKFCVLDVCYVRSGAEL